MFNDLSSPAALMLSRRSGKPRDMIAPGPDEATLRAILTAATRVPDHGKLAPWRFVVVDSDQRDALSRLIVDAFRAERAEAQLAEVEALDQFARQAPTLIVGLSSPVIGSKIPLWEQQLSVGAAGMALLAGVHAHGFVGGWLTGWPAYNDHVRDAFGSGDERIAGFFFVGTPSRTLEERPRPRFESVVRRWSPPY